ncbi:MAG: hypothetical protein NTW28_37685 [Candidatus Solibacter sp.]|nr:hypothetical protein [Candidatus Solibacter sp.]
MLLLSLGLLSALLPLLLGLPLLLLLLALRSTLLRRALVLPALRLVGLALLLALLIALYIVLCVNRYHRSDKQDDRGYASYSHKFHGYLTPATVSYKHVDSQGDLTAGSVVWRDGNDGAMVRASIEHREWLKDLALCSIYLDRAHARRRVWRVTFRTRVNRLNNI